MVDTSCATQHDEQKTHGGSCDPFHDAMASHSPEYEYGGCGLEARASKADSVRSVPHGVGAWSDLAKLFLVPLRRLVRRPDAPDAGSDDGDDAREGSGSRRRWSSASAAAGVAMAADGIFGSACRCLSTNFGLLPFMFPTCNEEASACNN